jgi:hypothetical protein
MTDEQLISQWTVLEPTTRQRRRIENRVFAWLEADQTSLATEWLGVIRRHPVAGPGVAGGGARARCLGTALRWLAVSVLL